MSESSKGVSIAEWWSSISDWERSELIGSMSGVWVFGGVQMCFALLPKEAKVKLYEVFCESAKMPTSMRQYLRQAADGLSTEFVKEVKHG